MRRHGGSPPHILLVEDNPGDVHLTREALEEGPGDSVLHVVDNGEKGLQFLRREGEFADAVRPDLILLDLNLPRVKGKEVLEQIKTDPSLCSIPVVILTSSEAPMDVSDAYRLHANCYVAKPANLDRYFELIQTLEKFWLETVLLPPAG